MSAPAPELLRVARAAGAVEAARAELERAMLDARQAGQPLRPIASAAGLSPEWTRRMIAKAAS